MPGRQRGVAGHGQERRGVGIDDVRPVAADHSSQELRGEIGDHHGGEHPAENRRAMPQERGEGAEEHPEQADPADVGEGDERIVELLGPVLDDPALEPGVELDQVGSSCFVDSISCCGLNGLPMKPLAPRCCAPSRSFSSTLPLNMITGIAPTP